MADPTPQQLQEQADAIATVAALMHELVGPSFDGQSAYYSDENFVVDFAGGEQVDVVHVYLLDGENPPILVLSPDGYREGCWLSKLQDKAAALASTWNVAPPAPDPIASFQPIDDSNLFQG